MRNRLREWVKHRQEDAENQKDAMTTGDEFLAIIDMETQTSDVLRVFCCVVF